MTLCTLSTSPATQPCLEAAGSAPLLRCPPYAQSYEADADADANANAVAVALLFS